MCGQITKYFSERYTDKDSISFLGLLDNINTVTSGILAYLVTSLIKFVVGKVGGRVLFYIGSVPISGGINAIQTVVTGLLWSKYIKSQIYTTP